MPLSNEDELPGVDDVTSLEIEEPEELEDPEEESDELDEDEAASTETSEVVEATSTEPVAEEERDLALVEILPTVINGANVRSAPSTTGEKVGFAPSGELYTYTEVQSGWYKIIIDDTTSGWVFGDLVDVKGE